MITDEGIDVNPKGHLVFKDRVILVTGANEGIGFAIAQLCHAQGAKIVLHGLNEARLAIAAKKLGPDVRYIAADLFDRDAPIRIIEFVMANFGRIDGLVNNAGLLDRCTLAEVSDDLIDRMFSVNFRAPLMLIKAAAARMVEQEGGGSIVNIGSVNASCGAPTLLVYSATKGALETITRNIGATLANKSVRVNQINVGWTETESEHRIQRAEGQPENWLENVPRGYVPSGSLLSPHQVAQHAAFWLSPLSAPVTGQISEVEQYPMIGRAFGANWSEDQT